MAKTAKGRAANRTRERNQKIPAQDDKLADFDERLGRAKGRRSETSGSIPHLFYCFYFSYSARQPGSGM
jgi:hypothetical protein